jgi:hypothetical protein
MYTLRSFNHLMILRCIHCVCLRVNVRSRRLDCCRGLIEVECVMVLMLNVRNTFLSPIVLHSNPS